MTRYTPLYIQPGVYPASQDRQMLGSIWPGPASSGMACSNAGLVITIQPGVAAIPTANASGTTLGISDAAEQVTLAAAPGSNSRIDLVCVQARGNDLDGGANNDLIFTSVTGTAAASPVAPATPAGYTTLYQATVTSAGAVTLIDVRPWALNPHLNGGISTSPTAATVPLTLRGAVGQTGDLLDITDNGATKRLWFDSTWTLNGRNTNADFVLAGPGSVILNAQSQQVLRLAYGAAWSDSANSTMLQMSGVTGNALFTAASGTTPARVGFIATGMTIYDGGYGSIPPPLTNTLVNIVSNTAAKAPLSLSAAVSQTGDLFQIRDSTGTRHLWYDANWTLNGNHPSTAALELKAQNGMNLSDAGGTYIMGALNYGSWSDTVTGAQIRSNPIIQFVASNAGPLSRFGVVANGIVFYDGYNSNYASITPPPATSLVNIVATYPTKVPLVIKGAPSQTGDSLQVQSNSGTVLSRFDSAGSLWLGSYRLVPYNGTFGNGVLLDAGSGYAAGAATFYVPSLAPMTVAVNGPVNTTATVSAGAYSANTNPIFQSSPGTGFTGAHFRGLTPNTSTVEFQVLAGGSMALGSAGSFGGGTGPMLFLANDTADPSANPTGGTIVFSSAGVLKARTPDGTVTTIAPAAAGGATGPAGGDLSGTYPNPTVARINGTSVPATPTAGQVLTATSGTAATWQAPGATGVSFPLTDSSQTADPNTEYQTRVSGDANYRFTMSTGGWLQWGSGAAGLDTGIQRFGAGTLLLNNSLQVSTQVVGTTPLIVSGTSGQTANIMRLDTGSGTAAFFGPTGALTLNSTAVGSIPLTVNGIASQSGDLFDIKNSGGTKLVYVDSGGALRLTAAATTSIPFFINLVASQTGDALRVLSSTPTVIFKVDSTGAATSLQGTGSNNAFVAQTTSDSNPRWAVSAGGTVSWGSGSAVADISLTRSGAGALKLTTTVTSGVPLALQGAAGQTFDLLQFLNSSNSVLAGFDATGRLYLANSPTWGSGTGPMMFLGNDTADPSANPVGGILLFSSAGVLKAKDPSGAVTQIAPAIASPATFPLSDAAAAAATTIEYRTKLSADTQYRFTIDASGTMAWSTGAATADATIFRAGANLLAIGGGTSGSNWSQFDVGDAGFGTNTATLSAHGYATMTAFGLSMNGVGGQTKLNAATQVNIMVNGGVANLTATSTGSQMLLPLALNTTPVTGTWLVINYKSATDIGLLMTGIAAQTGDFMQLKNSGGTTLIKVNNVGTIVANQGAASGFVEQSLVIGDAFNRFQRTIDGSLSWGGGTANFDMQMYRPSAGQLSIAGNASRALVNVAGGIAISEYASASVPLIVKGAASQSGDLFQIQNSGATKLAWFDSTGGLNITNDVISNFGVARLYTQTSGTLIRAYAPGGYSWYFEGASATFNFNVLIAGTPSSSSPTLQIQPSTATAIALRIYGAGGQSANIIQVGTNSGNGVFTVDPNLALTIQPQVATAVPLTIQGFTSQTANLMNVQGNSGSLFAVSSAGVPYSVQGAAGNSSFSAYVSGDNYPRFNVSAGGAIGLGPGNTGQDVSLVRYGVGALAIQGAAASTNAVLYLIGGSAGGSQLYWTNNGAASWVFYQNTSDPSFYFRDLVNARMHMTLTPGATAAAAITALSSTLQVDGGTITTAAAELVLQQTGDTIGTSRLRLRNRGGSAGAIFENPSINLVDFGFSPQTTAPANLRMEGRSAFVVDSANATYGEFQQMLNALGGTVHSWAGTAGAGVRGRFSIGSAGSWAGGNGPMVFLANDTNDPTGYPTGGTLLYTNSSSQLVAATSDGNTTVLAPTFYNYIYNTTLTAPTVVSSPYTVTHNLNTLNVMVELWDATTLLNVQAQVRITDVNHIQVSVSANAPNNINVVVFGVPNAPAPINPGDFANKTYVDARTPNLPAPVSSGTTIQSFTDVLGDVWIAKNGVASGAWKRARDALYTRVFRNSALPVTTTATNYLFDGTSRDAYGCYNVANANVYTCPVAGVYQYEASVCVTFTAASQFMALAIPPLRTNLYSVGAFNQYGHIHHTQYQNAGDTINLNINTSVNLNAIVGGSDTWMCITYLGTG